MLASLTHLLLWLALALAAVWTLSSLGVAVLAVAAMRGNRRVILDVPEASVTPGDRTAATAARLALVPAGAQSRLFV